MNASRPLVIGVLFATAGAVVAALGLYQHPVDRVITIAGIVVAVLGGIVIPNSGLEAAIKALGAAVEPLLPSLHIGTSRSASTAYTRVAGTDDPPVSPP